MLYQLGVLSIRVAPFNVDTFSRDSSTDFVEKPVLGRAPPLEYVGEGTTTFSMSGKLFPKKFDGMTELQILHMMRETGIPQFMLRGDGYPIGWVAITKVTESHTYLSSDGVGQVIQVSIELKRASPPLFGSLFAILVGIFT